MCSQRERQKIKTVTVGTFYDVHFHAGDLFTSPENDELSVYCELTDGVFINPKEKLNLINVIKLIANNDLIGHGYNKYFLLYQTEERYKMLKELYIDNLLITLVYL